MSVMSSVLRWLDGESPGSSSQVMSSKTKADDIANIGAHLQTPSEELPNDRTNDNVQPDHSSVMAIEADLMEVSTKAVHAVRDWGNYLFSLGKLTSEHVSKTAMQLKSVLEDKMLIADTMEDNISANESESKKSLETVVAPWVGYNEQETMKTQILALSKDKRNFMRSPPASSQFFFDYDVSYPVALVMLGEDPNLKMMRFELVPKHLREETFWRNYFYRVSLVKQSVQLTSLSKCPASKSEVENDEESMNSESVEPASAAHSEQLVTDNLDVNMTLSACEYVPDDVQDADDELDDNDYEFVSATEIDSCGNG